MILDETTIIDPATRYMPRGGARAVMKCRDPEVLIEGPAGTGKSRALLEKAHLVAMKYAKARILITRKSRESMSETVLGPFEREVLDPYHRTMLRVDNGPHRRFRQTYEYANGSVIVVCGMDKPEKVMSAQFDLIFAFEATELSEHDWEMLQTRLRNFVVPYQQGIADCNPAAPTHWLNQRANEGRMTRVLSRHEHNPVLHDGDDWTTAGRTYLATLDALTGPRRDRLRFGRWTAADGVVYETFDAAIHVVDRFDVPDDWRRIRVIDFGYENPFVCQWWAIDGDGAMILYREIYMSHRTVAVHAGQIRSLSEGETYEVTISDHDSENRASLREHGIETVAATKLVSPGIQAVQQRLPASDNGRRRLTLMRDSAVEVDARLREAKLPTCTAEEFDSYIWRPTPDGRPVKDEPLKANDHGMDAMRYAVAYVDSVGAPAFEFRIMGGRAGDDDDDDGWPDDDDLAEWV